MDELRAEGDGEAAWCFHLLCVSLLLSSFPAGKHSPCTTTEVSIDAANLLSFVCFLITCLDRFARLSVGVLHLPLDGIKAPGTKQQQRWALLPKELAPKVVFVDLESSTYLDN